MRFELRARAALPRPAFTDIAFEEEPPRHLHEYLAVVRRHSRLVLTCFAVTMAVAVLATLVMPRRYTASTRLQVGRESAIQLRLQNNVLSLDDSQRNDRAAVTFVGTQAAALRSRDLAERVMRSYGLYRNEGFLAPARHRNALPPVARDVREPFGARGLGTPATAVAASTSGEAPPDPDLLDDYLDYLTVKQVPGTDLIDVAFVTPSPALSAFLASAHAQAYVEANEEARHATDVVAQGFLARKLADARRRLKRADSALERFAARFPAVAVDREHQIGGQRITELSNLLTRAEADRVGLESRYEFLTSKKADPLAYFLERPGVQKLRLALLDVRAQRAGFDGRLGANHPRMAELKRLDHELERQLRSEVSRGVASVRARYEASRQRENQLRRGLEEQQRVTTRLNRLGARYELLRNDVDKARALHTSLLEQQMATAANADLGPSNVRVIERAEVPQYPSWPKIPLNLALGMVGGLLVGVGAAFGRDYFDQSVHSSDEVERTLQLPVLAAIPNFAFARQALAGPNGRGNGADGDGADHAVEAPPSVRSELVLIHEPASPVSETFRSMRTALLFAPTAVPRVIVVTSARPSEGKTVASVNLAIALAQSGARVVLVDADFRHPRCHRLLGVHNVPGLSTFLAAGGNLDDDVQHVDPPGLFFLASGPLLGNAPELIGSARLHEALGTLRADYDFVIVDTPPALAVTDAVLLAREADGVVLVVKGNHTPRDLVRRTQDRLQQAGASILGVLVNNVERGWGDPYFYDPYTCDRGMTEGSEAEQGATAGLVAMLLRQTAELKRVGRFARGSRAS